MSMEHEGMEIPPELEDFWEDAASSEVEPPSWIVEGVVPPGLMIVGGPPKSNKTTVVMGLAAQVSGHDCKILPPFMMRVNRPGRVMLLEAEHSPGDIKYMIEEGMGCSLKKDQSILCAKDSSEFRLDDPGGLSRLLRWLDVWKPRLFVIDPLREFHECEEKDSGEMQRLMRPLRRWALANDACVLAIHHTSKPGEGHSGVYSPLELRGSSAFAGMANGMLMVTPAKQDGVVTIAGKYKRGPSFERVFQLGIYGSVAGELLTPNDDKVLKALWQQHTVKEIGATLGFQAAAVEQSLLKLERNGKATRDVAGFWVPRRT